jgi:fumarate reductase flavoprotein subunit
MAHVDIAIVGAGTAGMPAAIEAATAGANVVVIEQSDRVGGTLHVSAGQMSGACTRLQRARGIADSPAEHLADAMRISCDTCNTALVGKATGLAGETIDWLMAHGFDIDPACPAILHLHEAYRIARTYWGREGGRSILKVLRPLFDAAMALPNAELRMGMEARSLIVGADGAVAGLRLRDVRSGAESELLANRVVLATGGYGGNPAMFARLTEAYPLYTPALTTSTGQGIVMAEALGAELRYAEHFIPTFAGIEEAGSPGRVIWEHVPSLTPQVRPPWEIYVGRDGRRFVREDSDSVDARERALMLQPGLTFWTVFDDAILRDAPPLLPGWSEAELAEAWASSPSFVRADTLDELAARTGIDAARLTATIAEYNHARALGTPDPLGRQHRPCPIGTAPLRAIRMHGIVLKTPAGLAVNEDMNVLDIKGNPIANLYAIGEAIGGATLSGNSFVSGMSVTPALAFGRWLGRHLAERRIRVTA